MTTTHKHPLLRLQDEVRDRICSINTGMERTKGHKPDISTEQSIAENNRAIVRRLEMRLRAIRAAVERLEDGSYGTCPGCEEKIPAARLEAVPEALFCVSCLET